MHVLREAVRLDRVHRRRLGELAERERRIAHDDQYGDGPRRVGRGLLLALETLPHAVFDLLREPRVVARDDALGLAATIHRGMERDLAGRHVRVRLPSRLVTADEVALYLRVHVVG